MKNWKTTVGGLCLAVGAALQTSGNETMHIIGACMVAVGGVFLGINAKDKNVTGGSIQQ